MAMSRANCRDAGILHYSETARAGWPACDERRLPNGIEVGQSANLEDVETQESQTKPPPRFSESTLVKELESLGIVLTEGFGPEQLEGIARDADVFVVGNVVSRGNPLMEAILDAGYAYASGPQWLYENVLRGKWVLERIVGKPPFRPCGRITLESR